MTTVAAVGNSPIPIPWNRRRARMAWTPVVAMYPSDANRKMAIPATRIGRVPRVSINQPAGGRRIMAMNANRPMMSPIWDEVPPRLAT